MIKFISSLVFVVMGTVAYAADDLSDGQITKALITINEGELEAAKIALGKTSNDQVKSFATTMSTEHSANLAAIKDLGKRVGIKEENSTLSVSLLADAKAKNAKVRIAKGLEFDKAYLDEQLKMHQAALDTIDQKFLPEVANSELKEHIQKTRTAVATHLEHAKSLRASLN